MSDMEITFDNKFRLGEEKTLSHEEILLMYHVKW